MKAKAKRALKHLTKVKTTKWAIEALKDYFNLCEEQVLEADLNVTAQIVLNKKREKVMAMLGIYVHPGITLNTVDFLYDNFEELYAKNKGVPLTNVLFQLQILFDDMEGYSEICDYDLKPMITVTDVREQKRKLNDKYKTLKLN